MHDTNVWTKYQLHMAAKSTSRCPDCYNWGLKDIKIPNVKGQDHFEETFTISNCEFFFIELGGRVEILNKDSEHIALMQHFGA